MIFDRDLLRRATRSIGSVTGGACRNIGVRDAVLKDLLSRGHEFLWSVPEWFGIESPKIRGKSRFHIWGQDTRHVEHDIVLPSVLNKSS